MKKTVFLLFCLVLFANPIYSQWHYNLPTPTHGNAAVAINDIIYSFGGDASPAIQYFSGLEAYNTQSGTWTSKSPMSFGRQSLGGIAVNGKIYAIGGHNINSVPYNEEYNPATNTWVTKTSMPTARSHFGIAVLGDTIYTIGGNASGTITGLVESYNVATDQWTTRASLSEGRYVSVTAAINGKIYLIGGLPASNTSKADGKIFEYNPASGSWLQKTSELTPTTFSSATYAIGGKIYVIGGAASFGITRKVQVYDPNTDTWTYGDSLLIGRVSPTAVVVSNRIYVSNGIASPSVAKTDMEYLDLNLTDVADNYSSIPKNYYLSQNYPNPFNPTTTINYLIPKSSFVTLKIFDALGREIVTLVNEEKSVGIYQVQFNASKLSSGIYFYRIQAGDFVETKKLVLLK